jgi:hypothetical protein
MIITSRRFLCSSPKNIPEYSVQTLKWNGIKDENIKPGMKLKING